jgi:hypothetical protein
MTYGETDGWDMYYTLHMTYKHECKMYRLAKGWTAKGSDFESRQEQNFSCFRVVQTGSGAHLASYPIGTGVFLPGGKAARL